MKCFYSSEFVSCLLKENTTCLLKADGRTERKRKWWLCKWIESEQIFFVVVVALHCINPAAIRLVLTLITTTIELGGIPEEINLLPLDPALSWAVNRYSGKSQQQGSCNVSLTECEDKHITVMSSLFRSWVCYLHLDQNDMTMSTCNNFCNYLWIQ